MSTVGKHTQPVSGFSPLSIGGCSLWLDATSTSNFALSGSNITTWYDRSPFSNHATASNGIPLLSNAAINGRPAVYLSNAPSLHGSVSLTNAGVAGFLVIRPLSTGQGRGDQRIFSAATPGNADWNSTERFLVEVTGYPPIGRFNRANAYIPRANVNPFNNYVVSWAYDGASNYYYLNGADADIVQGVALSNSAFNVSRYAIGNQSTPTTESFDGLVGEVIVYNDKITTTQRQAVEGYLAWKWGIAPALATTFSPLTSLSNCAVWFDGADATTFTLSGSNITQWRDKAASNTTTNIGTPVYTSNAVNGVAGVLLDVNAGFQVSPMSNPANRTTLSVYGVITTGSGAQNNSRIFTVGRISDGTTNNDFNSTHLWTLFRSGDGTFYFQHAGSAINAGTTALAIGTPCLISLVFSGTTATLWVNGSNAGSINTTNTLNFDRLGIAKNINPNAGSAYDAFAGTVGEFLMFYEGHTEAQRLQVESYLASKWNTRVRSALHLVPTHAHALRRPALRAFQPTDIPGCVVWLDAADPASFTFSSGSNVSLWRDKSPNANNFSNAGTVVLSSNAIVLSGSSYLRSSAQFEVGNTYCTIVTKLTGNAGYAHLTGFDNIQPAATMGSYGIRYDGTKLVSVDSADYSSVYTVNGTFNATNVAPYNTSTPYASRHIVAGTANRGGTTFIRVGAYTEGRYYIGEIYEVLFYSSTPSTSDRLRLEAYLAEKWGIRGSMGGPAHPYRYGPWGGLPASVPGGCTLWLDAADATTLTLSGSTVIQWNDKSGFNRHATAFQTGPVLSNRGLVFNGSGVLQGSNATYLHNATTGEWTAFVVFTAAAPTSGNPRIFNYPGIGQLLYIEGGRLNTYVFSSPAGQLSGRTVVSNTHYIAVVTNSATTTSHFVNGTTDATLSRGTLPTASNTLYYIGGFDTGGSDRFAGTINEILMVSNAMTTTERQQVEGYLAEKWGLRGSMIASHPYLTGPQSQIQPASIQGCALWLDAADASTFTLSGSNVTQWRDKSGAGLVAGSNSSNPLPTFTSNAVQFGPGQALLVSNVAYRNTWTCAVAMNSVTLGYRWFISPFPDATQVMMGMQTQFTEDKIWPGKLPGRPADITGRHIEITTGSPYAWVRDGTQQASNSTVESAVVSSVRVGLGANADGGFGQGASQGTYQIYELVIFSNVLTTTQRQQLEGYLAWKWGIGSNLPGPSSNWATLTRTLTAEFDPRSIGACGAWFDAGDPATIQFSSGSNMSRWLDKSGLQNHAITIAGTPVYTSNTLNGRPVVTFTGTQNMRSSYAPATSTTPQTMIVVLRPSNITGVRAVLTLGPSGSYSNPPPRTSIMMDSNWTTGWFLGAGWGGYNGAGTGTALSTTRTDIVVSTWYGGSNGNTSANGTQGPDSNATTPALATKNVSSGCLLIGANVDLGVNTTHIPFIGYVAEVLVYGKALTVAERQRVEGYLAWKWNLQSQLPALHPYVSAKF